MASNATRLAPVTPVPYALILGVAAITAIGAMWSARVILQQGSPATGTGQTVGSSGAERAVATSFGRVAITQVEIIDGLTSKDLGGMTHGINDYVSPDKARVQVSLILTNSSPRTVDYSPLQFAVISKRTGQVTAPTGSNVRPDSLRSGASIDAVLSFVVPRDGSRLSLEFFDPVTDDIAAMELGRTTRVSASELRESGSGSHAGSHTHGDPSRDGHR